MALTIGNNIASIQAQRKLGISTLSLEGVYERLSSGQRINRAADDAAGLAIADSLRSQQRVATVAIRNANDGISTVAIADGALSEIGTTLSRLAELSEQSANGVFGDLKVEVPAEQIDFVQKLLVVQKNIISRSLFL